MVGGPVIGLEGEGVGAVVHVQQDGIERLHGHHEFDAWEVELHGHRAIYRTVGSGPAVVLIHGMVNSSRHWEQVALRLADRYQVIAPDLIGMGESDKIQGSYSGCALAPVDVETPELVVLSYTVAGPGSRSHSRPARTA